MKMAHAAISLIALFAAGSALGATVAGTVMVAQALADATVDNVPTTPLAIVAAGFAALLTLLSYVIKTIFDRMDRMTEAMHRLEIAMAKLHIDGGSDGKEVKSGV